MKKIKKLTNWKLLTRCPKEIGAIQSHSNDSGLFFFAEFAFIRERRGDLPVQLQDIIKPQVRRRVRKHGKFRYAAPLDPLTVAVMDEPLDK
jgi:hypothetical protein